MANLFVSGHLNSFVNGEYIDQNDGTWRKIVSEEDDDGGFIDVFFFVETNLWYLQGSSVYSTAAGESDSDPTTLSWNNDVVMSFGLEESPTPTPTLTPSPTPSIEPLSPVEERDAKYQTENETGTKRFRRLVGLGYV
jgi:hypothetical protein